LQQSLIIFQRVKNKMNQEWIVERILVKGLKKMIKGD